MVLGMKSLLIISILFLVSPARAFHIDPQDRNLAHVVGSFGGTLAAGFVLQEIMPEHKTRAALISISLVVAAGVAFEIAQGHHGCISDVGRDALGAIPAGLILMAF